MTPYDRWKTRSDLDDSDTNAPDDRLLSQCDACGEYKADCIDTTTGGNFPMDVHVCPACRGE